MSKKKSAISSFFLDLPLGAEFLVKIKSGSMSPLFLVGDSVLVRKVDFSRIRRGDIVCFYQNLKKSLVIHRVIQKKHLDRKRNFRLVTRGDNAWDNDFSFVTKENFVGLIVTKVGSNQKANFIDKLFFILLQRFMLRFRLIRNFFY